jgi:CheY-like chemotaxis protein
VLLVDDDPLVLRALRAMLARGQTRYAVSAVQSVPAALEALACDPADIIVSDVQMPGQSGMNLYREVACRWPGLERGIVFLTGGCSDQLALEIRDTGRPVLGKPVSKEMLLWTVQYVAERARGD